MLTYDNNTPYEQNYGFLTFLVLKNITLKTII